MHAARLLVGVGRFAIACWIVACSGDRVRLGDGPIPQDPLVADDAPQGLSGQGDVTDVADAGAVNGSPIMDAGDVELADALANAAEGCVRGEVASNEVVWIGDSWFTDPGVQRSRVRDLARMDGALSPFEDYESLAAPAATLNDVIAQYQTRQARDPKAKVLLMDGGTWDTYLSQGSEASVTAVVETFGGFLGNLRDEGFVEHIVYMLVPELQPVPGVAALRPGLKAACEASVVPCHFLDLEPLWAGHPEFTAGNGIQASEQGAAVIADEIWAIMRDNCIAQ